MTENGLLTLRTRLSKGDCLVAPGVYDPFSARIVEKLGFEALYLGEMLLDSVSVSVSLL